MRVLLAVALVALALAPAPAAAQAPLRPDVVNGQVVDRAVSGGLAQTIAQVAAASPA